MSTAPTGRPRWSLLHSVPPPDCRQYDAGGDQQDAEEVVAAERFAERDHCEQAAEYRDQMDELAGSVGTDQFDPAIEEQVGDESWEHAETQNGEQHARRRM